MVAFDDCGGLFVFVERLLRRTADYDDRMKRMLKFVGDRLVSLRLKARTLSARRNLVWIAGLSVVVITLEVAQSWPEILPGGHVLSVFARGVIYSIIAALIFNLIVVEIPSRRRARAVYEYNRSNFETLLMLGPGSLILYGLASRTAPYDPWDWQSVRDRAKLIHKQQPQYFDARHRAQMELMIRAIGEALSEIGYAQSFLSIEVSQAIATFPSANGLNQLQVDELTDGSISWHRDAHICWSATEGARRLYWALKEEFPEVEFRRGEVILESGERFTIPESILIRS